MSPALGSGGLDQPRPRPYRGAPLRFAIAAALFGLAGGHGAPARRLPGLHRRGGAGSLDLSHIQHSNLGGQGPDKDAPHSIRFHDVSTVAGTFLDLVIDQQGGYTPIDASQNGKAGHGVTNINIKPGTKVNLVLKFVQSGTDIPAPMGRLYLTTFLTDHREKVRVDYFSSAATIVGFKRYCVSDGSSVKAHVVEDPASITFTAPSGQNTAPSDLDTLSQVDRSQAVTFYLHGSFEIPITVEVASGGAEDVGVDFAFSGTNSISDSCRSWRPEAMGGSLPDESPASTTAAPAATAFIDTSGCQKICKVNGVAASCKARVDWVAENQYTDQAKPCETAYSLVSDICGDACKKCSKEAACSPSAGRLAATTTTTEHHDCDDGFETWTTSWTQAKQEWCCENKDKGCPTTKTQTTTTTLATTTTEAVTTTTVTTVPYTTEPYDCGAGLAVSEWSAEHTAWCCKTYIIGCTATTTTATTSTRTSGPPSTVTETTVTETTVTETTVTQTTTTATTTITTTPRYDCDEGYFDWEQAWDVDQQDWCCEYHQRGCRPTTAEPFDCVRGFATWEMTWSDSKKGWCCEYHNRGCPPTTTEASGGGGGDGDGDGSGDGSGSGSGSGAGASRCGSGGCSQTEVASTAKEEEFDCDDSGDEGTARWSYEQQAYCCQHHQKGCHFVARATTTMQLYDCEERGGRSGLVNIPGFLLGRWGAGSTDEEWPREKREWCCAHHNVRCPRPTAAPPAGPSEASCRGDSSGWDYKFKAWCCQNYALGCEANLPRPTRAPDARPYNCSVALNEWALGWSDEKKAWCCQHESKGCGSSPAPSPSPSSIEPFDCRADFSQWTTKWSYRKKAYCCRQYARGCHVAPGSEPYSCEDAPQGAASEPWPDDQQDYCCRVHGRGCPSTTLDRFDCTAGYSRWRIGWSEEKAQWCCRRYARGCGARAPAQQPEFLIADGGSAEPSGGRQRTPAFAPGDSQPARLFTPVGDKEPLRDDDDDRGQARQRLPGVLARAPPLLVVGAAVLAMTAMVATVAAWRSGNLARWWRSFHEAPATARDRYFRAVVGRDVEEPPGTIADLLIE